MRVLTITGPDHGSDATFSEGFYGAYVVVDNRRSTDSAMSPGVSFSIRHRLTVEATVIDPIASIYLASFIHDLAVPRRPHYLLLQVSQILDGISRDTRSPFL